MRLALPWQRGVRPEPLQAQADETIAADAERRVWAWLASAAIKLSLLGTVFGFMVMLSQIETARPGDSGVDYWLRSDHSGLYRAAMKSDIDAEPKPDAAKRHALKAPLAVGTSWQSNATAYLLRRRQEFARETRHTHPNAPMVYTIEAAEENCPRARAISTLAFLSGGTQTPELVEWR